MYMQAVYLLAAITISVTSFSAHASEIKWLDYEGFTYEFLLRVGFDLVAVMQHTQGSTIGCTIAVSPVITGFMQPMQLVFTIRVGIKIWGLWCFFPTHIENARLSYYDEKYLLPFASLPVVQPNATYAVALNR